MSKISDISFIGSGISSSYTILHFLDLLDENVVEERIDITIIDKYSEFHTGIPYGTLALDWLSVHAIAIEDNNWDNLFIPRCFFGCYLNAKMESRIEELQEKGVLKVNYVKGEVIDLDRENEIYKLFFKEGKVIQSDKVVLSVGSLPKVYLWEKQNIIEKNNLLFINDSYDPKLEITLSKIKEFTSGRKGKQTNVFIIGANASALEMIYKLNDAEEIKLGIDNFFFISTQGILPDAVIDEIGKKTYAPFNLKSLITKDNISAKEIAEAAYKDLDYAESLGLKAATTVEIISKNFGVLLSKLTREELEEFACYYGNEIGRRQRCAGYHYIKTINNLKKENRFRHIAGRFEDLKKSENEYQIEYLNTESKKSDICNDAAHIVINCIGGATFSDGGISGLLENIIQKGYGEPNNSQVGLKVNNSLEAFENLHVMGPLLAGNVCDNKAVWHVEHCGRIIALSCLLSKKLGGYFFSKDKLKQVMFHKKEL